MLQDVNSELEQAAGCCGRTSRWRRVSWITADTLRANMLFGAFAAEALARAAGMDSRVAPMPRSNPAEYAARASFGK